MPSQTTSPPPLTVTVFAALWVSLGRCGVSLGPPGCDNGKLSLDRDLPAVYWDCPGSTTSPVSPQVTMDTADIIIVYASMTSKDGLLHQWFNQTRSYLQRRPSIDTVYDPVPARQICMDTSISYNHTIPNSGAYRPVRAECGEYLYCPPQRWLNNLHHGASVLLYHPCAPLHERLLLSVLARSCLPDHILTSHPQLNEHMPIALVSWGHTLELATVTSSDVCNWLETTTNTPKQFGGLSQSRKYNLLLIRSAEQHRQQHAHPEEHFAKMKSLRQCCEQTISSLLTGATEIESNLKKERLRQMKEEGKRRQRRAAIREKQDNVKEESARQNTLTHQPTNGKTGSFHNSNGTFGPSAGPLPGNRTLSDPPGSRGAPSKSKIQNTNQSLKPMATTPLESNMSDLRNSNPSGGVDLGADGVNREHNDTARPEARVLGSKDKGIDSAKQRDDYSVGHSPKEKISTEKNFDKGNTADGTMKVNEVVNVKERELEHKQTHSDTHSQHKSEKIGFGSVSKSQSESPPQPQQHQNPQSATSLPNSPDCGSCKGAEHCDCNKASGASAALVNKGWLRTPRTNEGVWAAAALGFLLILLTLSVLHTRLYRHWRTAPSLYWHDPQQDYDSVADVIRRRLRIANRRRKRGRRQECVLLPSSSSSEEHL